MPTLELDEFDIIDLSIEETRKLCTILDKSNEDYNFGSFISDLDKAQGDIKSGKAEELFIVIRISA